MPAWLITVLMNLFFKAVRSKEMKHVAYLCLKELASRNKWELDDRIIDDLFLN